MECTAKLVHDQRCQGLAVDILGDYKKRLAHLGDLFKDRQQVLHVAYLFLVNKYVWVFNRGLHLLWIGHEIRRYVAAIKLHALNHLKRGLHGLGLFNRYDALLAHLVHGLGYDIADSGVVIG